MQATVEQIKAYQAKYREDMKTDGFPEGNAPVDGWIYMSWLENKLAKVDNWGKKFQKIAEKFNDILLQVKTKGFYKVDNVYHCCFCRGYAMSDPVHMKHEPECPAGKYEFIP